MYLMPFALSLVSHFSQTIFPKRIYINMYSYTSVYEFLPNVTPYLYPFFRVHTISYYIKICREVGASVRTLRASKLSEDCLRVPKEYLRVRRKRTLECDRNTVTKLL